MYIHTCTYFFVVQPPKDSNLTRFISIFWTNSGMVRRKEAEPALGLLDDDIAPCQLDGLGIGWKPKFGSTDLVICGDDITHFHHFLLLICGLVLVLHCGTQSPSLAGHRSEDPQVQELCDYFNIEVWRGMQWFWVDEASDFWIWGFSGDFPSDDCLKSCKSTLTPTSVETLRFELIWATLDSNPCMSFLFSRIGGWSAWTRPCESVKRPSKRCGSGCLGPNLRLCCYRLR